MSVLMHCIDLSPRPFLPPLFLLVLLLVIVVLMITILLPPLPLPPPPVPRPPRPPRPPPPSTSTLAGLIKDKRYMAPYVAHNLSNSEGIQHLYESHALCAQSSMASLHFVYDLPRLPFKFELFVVCPVRVLSENALDARELRDIAGHFPLSRAFSCCERKANQISAQSTLVS